MLDGEIIVFELFGLVFSLHKQAIQTARDVDLIGCSSRAGDFGQALELLPDFSFKDVNIDIDLIQYRSRQSPILLEQGEQQMLDIDLLMAVAGGQGLRRAERLVCLL